MFEYRNYIYTIYQEKSFSKAARRLFVSQPWLSATVKKVEQELKTTLFDRSTTPLSLTEAGEYYIKQIEKIMDIEEETQQFLDKLNRSKDTFMRIGSSMFFCTYVLPQMLAEFRRENPQAVVTFTEGVSDMQIRELLAGNLDFLLEAERPNAPNVESRPWRKEELVLAVPTSYAINRKLSEYCYTFDEFLHRDEERYRRPPVPLAEFSKIPFMLLKEGNDSYQRSLELCRNAGFVPEVSLYMNEKGFVGGNVPTEEIKQLGFKIGLFPISSMLAAAQGMIEVLGALAEQGTTLKVRDKMTDPPTKVHAMMGQFALVEKYGQYYTC